ncbi:hypothetical protein DAMA08_045030 [Martiniozyma asiatica (nom. inval.)]|nr:hypothetical protein DAMA08_045030 [Martiniozyma asiatica]
MLVNRYRASLSLVRGYSRRAISDEELLADIAREERSTSGSLADDPPPALGPKYWKQKYTNSYKNVSSKLSTPLDDYVNKNLGVIKRYNRDQRKSVGEKIRVNINNVQWKDALSNSQLRNGILKFLHSEVSEKAHGKSLEEQVRLTDFQKRFYALMSAKASTIAKGSRGSGRSTALITTALNLKRSNKKNKNITSLLLVKSKENVLQYKRIIESISSNIGSKNSENNKIAQFIFRSNDFEENRQLENFKAVPNPHILVSTPQRLLDILSTNDPDVLSLEKLTLVGVDDFTSMIHNDLLLNTKRKAPIVQLLDYIFKLQEFKNSAMERKAQLVLIADDAASDDVVEQVKDHTKWIDLNNFAEIGRFSDETDLPAHKWIPFDTTVSTVLLKIAETENGDTSKTAEIKLELSKLQEQLAQPKISKNSRKKIERRIPMLESLCQLESVEIEPVNCKPFEYTDDPHTWLNLLYRSERGNDESFHRHRQQRRSKLSKASQSGEIELLCAGFEKVIASRNVSDWIEGKKILLVHQDEISSQNVLDFLSLRYPAAQLAKFNVEKDWDAFTKPVQSEEPKIYISGISQLEGIALPQLNSIFALGMDTFKSVKTLSLLATRMRPNSGLIPADKYVSFTRTTPTHLQNKNVRARLFIIAEPDFGDFERNFLERSFVVSGLVRQSACVEKDEVWSDRDQFNYETNMGLVESANGAIEFGGLHASLNEAASEEGNIKIG